MTVEAQRGGRGAQRLVAAAPRLLLAVVLLLPVERAPGAVQALVLMALIAAGWSVGWALAGRLLRCVSRGERAFAAAALGIVTCVVSGQAIGHLGLLTGWWFRGVLAAALVAAALVGRAGAAPRAGRAARPEGPPDGGSASLPAGRAPLRWRRLQRALLWGVTLLVLGILLSTVDRYRHAPPGRFSFDDTSYHLTTVATWNVHHDLRMPRFTYGDPRTPFYPFAAELLAWELTTPFAGGDFAARWMELPFALLTLVGLTLVARRVGAGELALLAPLLYLTVSETWPTMALTAGNDHALAFAAVVTVHGALLLRSRPGWGAGLYTGAGLGLMLATKYLAVIYAPLWIALVVLAVVTARRSEPRRARVTALAAVAAAALVAGGYAYLRNLVTTGNPIFPVALGIGGWSLPGWQDVAPELWSVRAADFDPWSFLWLRVDAFGRLFRYTMLPAALLAPLAAWVLTPVRRRVLHVWLFAMPIPVYLLFVRLVEDHRGVRYLLPGIAIAAVAVAWLVSRLPAGARGAAAVTLAALAAARWIADEPAAAWALPVALAVGWAVAARRRPGWLAHPKAVLAGSLAAAVALALSAPSTLRKYEGHRYDDERAAAAFERLAGPRPVRVAYAGWNQPYLYCGRRLSNALFMPPAAPTAETAFYRWRRPLEEPVPNRPRRAWERNLEGLSIDWVVWVVAGGGIRPEQDWMLRSPQRFSRAYADGRVELWQVRR